MVAGVLAGEGGGEQALNLVDGQRDQARVGLWRLAGGGRGWCLGIGAAGLVAEVPAGVVAVTSTVPAAFGRLVTMSWYRWQRSGSATSHTPACLPTAHTTTS